MGSGDRRSRKGKIWRGSYGKSRPKHITAKNKFVKPVTEKPKEKAK